MTDPTKDRIKDAISMMLKNIKDDNLRGTDTYVGNIEKLLKKCDKTVNNRRMNEARFQYMRGIILKGYEAFVGNQKDVPIDSDAGILQREKQLVSALRTASKSLEFEAPQPPPRGYRYPASHIRHTTRDGFRIWTDEKLPDLKNLLKSEFRIEGHLKAYRREYDKAFAECEAVGEQMPKAWQEFTKFMHKRSEPVDPLADIPPHLRHMFKDKKRPLVQYKKWVRGQEKEALYGDEEERKEGKR